MSRFLIFSLMALLLIGATISTQARSVPAPKNNPPITKNVLPEHKHTAACENTTEEPVQIICILDRSGSMQSLTEDVIGGYNSFLEKQRKEEGTAEVTTVLFDDKYEKISDAVNLNSAENLTSAIYYARGNTALMDAIGRTITETLGQMERNNICPAKRRVLIMIMTDGLENASTEYSKATVKALIDSTKSEYKWNYVFIGANIDSAAEATSIGIGSRNAMNYAPDSEGVRDSFNRMDEAAKEVRQKGTLGED